MRVDLQCQITFTICAVFTLTNAYPRHAINKRVVNGQPIIRGEWPFLVSLHYLKDHPYTEKSNMTHLCGGTLIHPRWVLTAAHCITMDADLADPDNWEVVIGEYNQFVDDEGEQVVQPEAFFSHPGFSLQDIANDIGLIKLKEDAVIGPYANTISMDNRTDLEIHTECKVGGWGQLSERPSGWGMYIPLETYQFILNRSECSWYMLHTGEMCVGVPQVNQSTIEMERGGVSGLCSGDSGGPLICKSNMADTFVVSGVVSSIAICGSSLFPGVYTTVSYYHSWVQDVITNNTPSADPNLTLS